MSQTKSYYDPLFKHMDQEHSVILLDSEMADIIDIVRKMDGTAESGAVNYLEFEKEARKFWQMCYGTEFPYKFSEWFWERCQAATGVKAAVWVKATTPPGITQWYIVKCDHKRWASMVYVDSKITLERIAKDLGVEVDKMWYLDESPAAGSGKEEITDHEHEKEVMMQAFDKVRQIFEGRSWIMEGRGAYPYNDDRYKEEVRYMYDEFDALFKDTWKDITSKNF